MIKTRVFDVAKYILDKVGPMTTWKLQKLVYYSQAWSLVWDETPLFEEKILAWANGPVCEELYQAHKGEFLISSKNFAEGNVEKLTSDQKTTIDQVIASYNNKSGQWLSELTHLEEPWKKARSSQNLQPGQRGSAEITLDSMSEYYGGLDESQNTL